MITVSNLTDAAQAMLDTAARSFDVFLADTVNTDVSTPLRPQTRVSMRICHYTSAIYSCLVNNITEFLLHATIF